MSLIDGTTVEVLNLEKIFVNYFAGSMELFFLLALIFFTYLAARFRMPNQITLVLISLFIIMMSPYFPLFYSITCFIIALFFYYILSRFIQN